MEYNQVFKNGEIRKAEEIPEPNTKRIREILEKSMDGFGWKVNFDNIKSQPYHCIYESEFKTIDIYIYCWRISNGGRKNRPSEKRIQIGISCDKEPLKRKNDLNNLTLILGIYENLDSKPIIVAWESEQNTDPGNSKSCFTCVEHISDALKNGFSQWYDSNNNLVCAFREEFFNLYISNRKFLHCHPIACINSIDKDIKKNRNNPIIKYLDLKGVEGIESINNYISNYGFNYSKDSLKNFYLSLKSKPFVILAGISGTGKSKLVKLFSEAIGAEYNLISVKPDWNDSTELLGYKNLNDKFIPGQLTEIILEASKDENKDKPYFVCLDEMNLARVEYYFSEYLSLIESRKRENDSIVTDKIFDSEDAEYNDLVFPDNLYIVGTVNMDDTTFGFSKKVLDRANTIEFSDVDLTLDFLNNSGEVNEIVGVDNSFLKTNFISLKELIHSNEIENKFIEDINNRIIEINNILKVYSRHFAYRVRDEILIYMAENKISNLFLEENSELTEEENEEISISKAFDYQIMQKILPLISGSDEYMRDILIDLFNYAFDKKERKEYIIDESNYRDKIDGIDLEKAKYKLTAKKLKDMLRGYDNGYATYWQ